MRPADADADSSLAAAPALLFGTVNGVIGVVVTLQKDKYEYLLSLQVLRSLRGMRGNYYPAFCRAWTRSQPRPAPVALSVSAFDFTPPPSMPSFCSVHCLG
jgi:hypothetical protein